VSGSISRAVKPESIVLSSGRNAGDVNPKALTRSRACALVVLGEQDALGAGGAALDAGAGFGLGTVTG